MFTRRMHRLLLTTSALCALPACYTYGPPRSGELTPARRVRVSFATPRDVRVVQSSGDTSLRRNVRRLDGTVQNLSVDSLWLAVGSGGVARGPSVAIVPLSSQPTFQVRHTNVLRTVLLTGGILAVALFAASAIAFAHTGF